MSVGEQEVEVLERLAEEEGLHLVLGPGVQRVSHVADCRVASADFAIFLDPLMLNKSYKLAIRKLEIIHLEYFPSPVLVSFVS